MAVFGEVSLGRGGRRLELSGFRFQEASHPPRMVLPAHAHRHANLMLVVSGGFRQSFHGRDHDCGPGTVVIKGARLPHADRFGDRITRTFYLEALPQEREGLEGVAASFRRPRLARPGVVSLTRRAYREFRIGDDHTPLALEGLALEVLALLGRTERPEPLVPRWLTRVRDLLEASVGEPLAMEALATEAGVHPVYLARMFRRHFDCTPGEFLRRRRVEAACRLLRTTERPLADLALELGFCDQSHFTRVFRRLTGETPGRYRRRRCRR